MNIFVTGASGFIGTKACPYLYSLGHKITAFSRSTCNFHSDINFVKGDSLASIFSKELSLKGIDCILHLAGKSHITNKMSSLETLNYIKDNVNETLDFAERCSKKSIKRFIFVSSIKVNGESTNSGIPFRETDIPKPSDAYAIIKYQIELGLFDIAKNSNMEVVIIRPPLMYGPGVKGYFGQLLDLIKKNIPLPLKSLDQNLRSFIYLENFLNFLGIVIQHPGAINNIFICSDKNYISTAELLNHLYLGMHNKNKLFHVSPVILKASSFIIGKSNLYHKLSDSLFVDNSKAYKILGWQPQVKVERGLQLVAKNYYKNNKDF